LVNKSMAKRMPYIVSKLTKTLQCLSSAFFELEGGWPISKYSIVEYEPTKSDPKWGEQVAFVVLRNNYFTKYNLDLCGKSN